MNLSLRALLIVFRKELTRSSAMAGRNPGHDQKGYTRAISKQCHALSPWVITKTSLHSFRLSIYVAFKNWAIDKKERNKNEMILILVHCYHLSVLKSLFCVSCLSIYFNLVAFCPGMFISLWHFVRGAFGPWHFVLRHFVPRHYVRTPTDPVCTGHPACIGDPAFIWDPACIRSFTVYTAVKL